MPKRKKKAPEDLCGFLVLSVSHRVDYKLEAGIIIGQYEAKYDSGMYYEVMWMSYDGKSIYPFPREWITPDDIIIIKNNYVIWYFEEDL